MKKIKRLVALVMAVIIASNISVPQVKASDEQTMKAAVVMAEFRSKDKGPDPSKGILIDEVWGMEADGTPYVDRIYMENNVTDSALFATTSGATPYKKFTRDKQLGAIGWISVSAYFSWDKSKKTAYVKNVTGDQKLYAISGTRGEKGTPGNNGTKKVYAKYSLEANRNLGGWTKYSVKMTCDYNGTVKRALF